MATLNIEVSGDRAEVVDAALAVALTDLSNLRRFLTAQQIQIDVPGAAITLVYAHRGKGNTTGQYEYHGYPPIEGGFVADVRAAVRFQGLIIVKAKTP